MPSERLRSRRGFLRLALAASPALVLPGIVFAGEPAGSGEEPWAAAGRGLVDPYTGAMPLTFPLVRGTYQVPIVDNWHVERDGRQYRWNHRLSAAQRAHDGVDIYPRPGRPLPQVYAPLASRVGAFCVRETNAVDSPFEYQVSGRIPPPWNLSRAIDSVSNLSLYGNFIWLRSIEAASRGYWVLLAHLQNEPLIRALRPDDRLATDSPIGVMGDTGNAAGTPQLHVEIRYPTGNVFACRRCDPGKPTSAINPSASLVGATRRLPAAGGQPPFLDAERDLVAPRHGGDRAG